MTSHPRIQFYFILTLLFSIITFGFGSKDSEAAPTQARRVTQKTKTSSSSAIRANSTRTRSEIGIDRLQKKPFSILAAISTGTSSIDEPGMDTSGNQTEIKLIASYALPLVNFEVGGGYFRNQVSGKAKQASSSEELYLSQYGLTTEATILSAAIRGRITDRIEVGPLVELLLGPDVGFSAGFGKSGITSVWLAGGEALYSIPMKAFVMKLGARYLTSTTLENRLSSLQATLQFGIPIL